MASQKPLVLVGGVIQQLSAADTVMQAGLHCVNTSPTAVTTTLGNVTGISLALLAGIKYRLLLDLFYQTSATTVGMQFAWTFSGSLAAFTCGYRIPTSPTAQFFGWSGTPGTAIGPTTGPGAVNMPALLAGGVQPLTSGTMQLQAKTTSGSGTVQSFSVGSAFQIV